MGFGKNEDYYNRDAIKLENIHYEVIKEAVTGYNLFNEGQLDMADIYGEYVKQNAANEELQTVLTSYIHYFKMNQKEMVKIRSLPMKMYEKPFIMRLIKKL